MTRDRVLTLGLVATLALTAVADEATVAVERGPFEKKLILSGSIQSGQGQRYQAPLIPGHWRLQIHWLIEEGTAVEPGDPLARLDPSAQVDELQQALASLDEKRQERQLKVGELERARLDHELALREAEVKHEKARLDSEIPEFLLSERDHTEAQIELERAQRALDEARLGVASHEADVRSKLREIDIEIGNLEGRIAQLEEEIASLTLRARAPGVALIGVNRDSGRPYQAGDSTRPFRTLVETPAPGSMEVQAWINEVDLHHVRVGQQARLRLDAYPEKVLTGEVTEVAAVGEVQDSWGSAPHYAAHIAIDSPDPVLMRPGMSVQCELTVLDLAEALLIPLQAVTSDGHDTFVTTDLGDRIELEPLAVNSTHLVAADGAGLDPGQALRIPSP